MCGIAIPLLCELAQGQRENRAQLGATGTKIIRWCFTSICTVRTWLRCNFFCCCCTAELVSEEQQRELLDIDGTSEVLEDGIRKLNTIGHYEVSMKTIPMS